MWDECSPDVNADLLRAGELIERLKGEKFIEVAPGVFQHPTLNIRAISAPDGRGVKWVKKRGRAVTYEIENLNEQHAETIRRLRAEYAQEHKAAAANRQKLIDALRLELANLREQSAAAKRPTLFRKLLQSIRGH